MSGRMSRNKGARIECEIVALHRELGITAERVPLLGNADLLMVAGAVWILAPVSDAVLDALATVGARAEDMEPETTESDGDDEDCAVAV